MTIPTLDPETVAGEVGTEGIDHLVAKADQICAYETNRIELANQGQIASLVETHRHLSIEEDRIADLLRKAPPQGNRFRLLRRAIFCWALTLLLAGSGCVLTILTLAPYRLGSTTWLFALGVSALTPFLIDEVLSHWPTIVKFLTPFATVAALAGIMLFALIRGYLLREQLWETQTSTVVIDDADGSEQPPRKTDFYASTIPALSMALLLIAFSMEVGAGIALFEARRSRPDESEDWSALRRNLANIRSQRAEIMKNAIDLRNEPAIFEARFHRDFYRALLTNAVRKALMKALLLAIGASCLIAPKAFAQADVDMVIAIDLTASVAVTGPDKKSEFTKNVDGVARLLAQIPTGAHVTVIGITDASFAQPYILMRALVGSDPGYFGERLTSARNQLLHEWKRRSAPLEPRFQHTDILGALELTSQILAEQPTARKEIFIFSDMRQNTPQLDLGGRSRIQEFATVLNHCSPIPDLTGVRVIVLGADSAGSTTAEWRQLEEFWTAYLRQAGADLERYSALRKSPPTP